jgi:hypothetical protein
VGLQLGNGLGLFAAGCTSVDMVYSLYSPFIFAVVTAEFYIVGFGIGVLIFFHIV